MTEYTRGTGSSGIMLISDNAPGAPSGTVEFWINSGNSSTFDHELPWGYTANGGYSGVLHHDYNANSGWNFLGSVNITYSQEIIFHLEATGTSGFGGPTDFPQWIQRATVPAAPNAPTFAAIGPTSLNVIWTNNGDGGSPITGYDVGYALTNTAPTTTISATGSPKTITGLSPGTQYYFWVRAQNSIGSSAWSASSPVQTIAGARIKVGSEWKFAVPYVKDAGVWKLAKPYVRTGGVWKETI